MNLIKRTTLHYQGNPQSVYEVNLWEVEEEKYDVNFIYTEFNSYSTAGTKTNQPVSLAEAEKIFYRFIRDKKKRGYKDIFQTSDDSMSITQPFFDDVERKRVILERLENKKPSKWKLDRAIWRAGELNITEATPLLIDLLGTGEDLRDYCIAWSLGWCGDKSTIPVLTQLYENPETPEFVSRIAFEALLKLADEGTKAALQMDLIASLPLELGRLARTSSPELFEQFAVNHSYYFFEVFEKLYQIDNPYIRSSILKILRRVPFQPNYFRSIRRIFKIAEYRCDAEVFAILAYRFERVAGNFNNDLLILNPTEEDEEEENKYQLDNRRVYDDELKKPQPIVAYSYQTQQYFRRRIWRSLKKLGENGDANYIKMATAILLEYSDNDDGIVVRSRFSQWDNYTRNIKQYWDKYADYLTFNHILYSNSPRFFFNSKKWFPRRGCDVNAEITVREEAFPRLWEQYPQALLKLLLESQCLAVHRFAVKVLRDCEDFCSEIDINTVIQLVYSRFDVTAAFGFELGLKRFELEGGNQQLLEYLANRLFQLHSKPKLLSKNTDLIASLITNPQVKIRRFICSFIKACKLESETAQRLGIRLIHELSLLEENQEETITDITNILLDTLSSYLIELNLDIVASFLQNRKEEVQKIGLFILMNYDDDNPEKLYIDDYKIHIKDIKALGGLFALKITFQSLDDNQIEVARKLILQLILHSSPDIRNTIKPIIIHLIGNNKNLAKCLASDFIEILLKSDTSQDSHADIWQIWKNHLEENKKHFTLNETIKLIDNVSCARQFARDLFRQNFKLYRQDLPAILAVLRWLNSPTNNYFFACKLFENEYKTFYNFISEIPTEYIVSIAINIRTKEHGRKMFYMIIERLRSNPDDLIEAIRLLECNWQHHACDLAIEVFSKKISIEIFTPNILFRIYESSSRRDVKDLAFNLVNKYFKYVRDSFSKNQVIYIHRIHEIINILIDKNHYSSASERFIELLKEDLHVWKESIDKETLFKILQAQTIELQELGILIINAEYQRFFDSLNTKDIILLANHNLNAARQSAQWILLNKVLDNNYNKQEFFSTLLNLLDSQWQDTRWVSAEILSSEITIEEFNSNLIIKIIESEKEDVIRLGQTLLTCYLKNIQQKTKDNPQLSIQTAKKIIRLLLTPEKRQGSYSYIVSQLQECLKGWIFSIDKQTLIELFQSETSSVQEFGGIILQENSDNFSHQLTTSEIVELSNQDILSIRQAAQKIFAQNLNRFRNNPQEMLEAVRILDAKWEDTRDFAFKIFTTEFNSQDFTSDILVAICDSNNAEARKMGRDLLARNFHEVDEEEYFIKLSEHPAQDMQKFVTNYFEKYAADNPQRLRELTPYFITVLSSINRNRTAKKRVLNFLKTESDKSQEAAKIIAEIISRESASMAIADKSVAIEIMLKIKNKYPDIPLPIQIQPVTEERRKSLKI